MMHKLWLCLFYSVCIFTIVFSLFWMALPKLPFPPSSSEDETNSSASGIAAQGEPEWSAQGYYLCDKGGRVAVYRCNTDGTPGELWKLTEIYVNLLPENDALRIKHGIRIPSERELDLLLEDLGG